MTSNRMEDEENFWLKSETKGFSFNDELEGEDDSNPWMKDLPNASKVKDELREEIVSVYSGISEGSSLEETHPNLASYNYPDFILNNNYEPDNDTVIFPDAGLHCAKVRQAFSEKAEEHRGIGTAVKGVICSLLIGQEVNLEKFRSLAEKKSLLAKAIEVEDGNAILAIVLFLQRSLRESLFQQILMENRKAADHYIRYLEKRSESGKLVDLLTMLGRTRDALIIRYKIIMRSEGNMSRIEHQLKHFYNADCNISDDYMAQVVKSHFQMIDCHKEIKGKFPDFDTKKHPSVLKTLGFLSQHFYEDSVPPFSPVCFRAIHNLNEKQFAWVNLLALAKVQKWPQIESLLLTKNWLGFGSTRDKCLLPLEDVCTTIKDAPDTLISIFLRLMDNTAKRIALAKKLKCHMVVIDVYKEQKDRVAILKYREYLTPGSKEDVWAESLLTKTTNKWKN